MGLSFAPPFPEHRFSSTPTWEVPCESRNAGAAPTAAGGSQCQPGVAVTGETGLRWDSQMSQSPHQQSKATTFHLASISDWEYFARFYTLFLNLFQTLDRKRISIY